jgi:hypothetical protein
MSHRKRFPNESIDNKSAIAQHLLRTARKPAACKRDELPRRKNRRKATQPVLQMGCGSAHELRTALFEILSL